MHAEFRLGIGDWGLVIGDWRLGNFPVHERSDFAYIIIYSTSQ
jgi:hypothetical protein